MAASISAARGNAGYRSNLGEPVALTPLPIAYRDVAVWQQRWAGSEDAAQQLAWWAEQLHGAPTRLELPGDFPRPAQQSHRGASVVRDLPDELGAQVCQLARAQGATVFMTLLAAFQILLQRYSGQDDVCIGTPVANRSHAETEDLVGLFVNTLVLRTRIAERACFTDVLAQVKQTALGAYARQALPFERLVEHLRPERSLAHAPLFQVMFVLQNNEADDFAFDGLVVQPIEQTSNTAKFDLTLSVQDSAQGLQCHWEFASDLFRPARIRRMAAHFEVLLAALTRTPEAEVRTLEILTAEDQAQLQAWNQTATAYPQAQTIVDLFEAQVERTPQATAVVFENQSLSYLALDQRANRVARALMGHGVKADTLVGLCVPRSLEMVIGLLGILKAGGAYVRSRT